MYPRPIAIAVCILAAACTDPPLPLQPLQPRTAVSCHNCYDTTQPTQAANLTATLDKLEAAMRGGADVLELDVKQQGGDWIVAHDGGGASHGARLHDVIRNEIVCAGWQPLFIEVKAESLTRAAADGLIDIVRRSACITATRPVVFRALRVNEKALRMLMESMTATGNAELAKVSRFHSLYSEQDVKDGLWEMDMGQGNQEVDGVEFQYTAPGIDAVLQEAHDAGLLTGLWTFPEYETSELCERFAGVADTVTVDGEPSECKRAMHGELLAIPSDQ